MVFLLYTNDMGPMLAAQGLTEGSKPSNFPGQLGLDWDQDKPCPSCLQTFSAGGKRQQLCCNMWGQHKSQHCHWAVTLSVALPLNTRSSCFLIGCLDVTPVAFYTKVYIYFLIKHPDSLKLFKKIFIGRTTKNVQYKVNSLTLNL